MKKIVINKISLVKYTISCKNRKDNKCVYEIMRKWTTYVNSWIKNIKKLNNKNALFYFHIKCLSEKTNNYYEKNIAVMELKLLDEKCKSIWDIVYEQPSYKMKIISGTKLSMSMSIEEYVSMISQKIVSNRLRKRQLWNVYNLYRYKKWQYINNSSNILPKM